ncbi:MAG: hypothetical protein AABX74_00405 [Nanoarchaeota archaeon]
MKLIKNKKAQEGAGEQVMGNIIKWIILFALLIFALFWFSGLGDKILSIIKSRF